MVILEKKDELEILNKLQQKIAKEMANLYKPYIDEKTLPETIARAYWEIIQEQFELNLGDKAKELDLPGLITDLKNFQEDTIKNKKQMKEEINELRLALAGMESLILHNLPVDIMRGHKAKN